MTILEKQNPNWKSKDNYNRLKYDPIETHHRLVDDTIEKAKDDERKSCWRIEYRKLEDIKILFTTKNT